MASRNDRLYKKKESCDITLNSKNEEGLFAIALKDKHQKKSLVSLHRGGSEGSRFDRI